MKHTLSWLGLVLALQIVLALVLNFGPGRGGDGEPQVLIAKRDSIDRIDIVQGEQTIRLTRKDGQWRMPDYHDLPVPQSAIDLMFERFEKLPAGPVTGTTSEAHKRFRVDASAFERKVSFASGDRTVLSAWLGSAAGSGRGYLRIEGQDEIREAPFTAYQIEINRDAWVDRSILRVMRDDATGLRFAGVRMHRPAGGDAAQSAPQGEALDWVAEGLSADKRVDQGALRAVLDQLSGLLFETALGSEVQPGYGLDKPVLEFSVERRNGAPRTYRFGKLAESDGYVLQLSDSKTLLRIEPAVFRNLAEVASAERLFVAK